MLLNLNQVMGVIFNVPAAIFSTVRFVFFFLSRGVFSNFIHQIAACRAVRRLTKFSYKGPQMMCVFHDSTHSKHQTDPSLSKEIIQQIPPDPFSKRRHGLVFTFR
jgi:hypothetical protein